MEALDDAYASRILNNPSNQKLVKSQQQVTSLRTAGIEKEHFNDSIERKPRAGLNNNPNAGRQLAALSVLSVGAP
jgi:hypothetical protein